MIEDFRLRVFMYVVRTGSFTSAAKSLGVTQPAVSQNINALEKSLGVKLFYRSRGEVSLTSAGYTFKDYAENIISWYEAADRMFGTLGRATINQPVSIVADNVVADYILPQSLSGIYAVRGDIAFNIISSESVSGVRSADVVMSVSPSPDTMDFEGESRLVGVMDAAVVVSPRNRILSSAAMYDDDINSSPRPFSTLAGVHVSNSFAVWNRYYDLLTPDLISRGSMVSSSIEAIKYFVENSDDVVGVVPMLAVRNELETGRLLRLPVLLPEFAFDIHFNPSRDFSVKEICNIMIGILKENLK